jgi:hypothetical protein
LKETPLRFFVAVFFALWCSHDFLSHIVTYMAKPPKPPRPPKPPFRALGDHHIIDPKISDAHKILIGTVIERWSKLEGVMDDLIWSMLRLEFETGRAVTGKMDAFGKIQLLRRILPFTLSDDRQRRLSQIVDRIDFRREDRNFIAHGTWGTLMPENTPICSSLRPTAANPDEVACRNISRCTDAGNSRRN